MPLPNLSSRFGYTSSTARIIGQRGAAVAGGTFAQFVHHGSAELGRDPRQHSRRYGSRERADMRGRSTPAVSGRQRPQGPEERNDWLDALQDMDARVKTLESSNRNLAQAISQTAAVADDNFNKITNLHEYRVKDKQYVEKTFYREDSSIKNVMGRFDQRLNDVANSTAEVLAIRLSSVDIKVETWREC